MCLVLAVHGPEHGRVYLVRGQAHLLHASVGSGPVAIRTVGGLLAKLLALKVTGDKAPVAVPAFDGGILEGRPVLTAPGLSESRPARPAI